VRSATKEVKEFLEFLPDDNPEVFAEILAEIYSYSPEFDDWTVSELIEFFEHQKDEAWKRRKNTIKGFY
jgi:hypothetical protein